MSEYSVKTGMSSFLKSYNPADRDRSRNNCINKVRFEMPKNFGLLKTLQEKMENQNDGPYNEFVAYLKEDSLSDQEFKNVMLEAKKAATLLKPGQYKSLVESLLSLQWLSRDDECCKLYTEFTLELLIANNKYIDFAIGDLVSKWVPRDKELSCWPNGSPIPELWSKLLHVHKLLENLLNIIPQSFNVLLRKLKKFPYYKNPSHVIGGYLHNVLWLLEYHPKYIPFVLEEIFYK